MTEQHARYIGSAVHLRGETALIRPAGETLVKVQFDKVRYLFGVRLDLGWHLMAKTDFQIIVFPTPQDEMSIKPVFVKTFGSDRGWLEEPGSWFIEGFKAALRMHND